MTRPNRYPYTRSQWTEDTVDYFTYEDGIYFTERILKNRITGENQEQGVLVNGME